MISVIIIDYKTADRCVQYISDFYKASDIRDISFIIVDNTIEIENGQSVINGLIEDGYTINRSFNISYEAVRYQAVLTKEKTDAIYVSTGKNLGFAKANNLGAEIARQLFSPSFLLFSNSDIKLPEILKLSVLVDELNNNNNCAMVGPKVLGLDGKDQSPGKYLSIYKRHIVPELLWPINKLIPGLKFINKDLIQNAQSGLAYRIIGAFMLIKVVPFFEIKGFDEGTFLYAEEPIISEKFISQGLTVRYVSEVSIVHEQGVATTNRHLSNIKNLIIKRKRVFESEMYYYKKYRGINMFTEKLARLSFALYIFKIKFCAMFSRK